MYLWIVSKLVEISDQRHPQLWILVKLHNRTLGRVFLLSLSLFERRIEPGGKKLNGEIDALPLHPSSTSVAILFVGQLVYSEELESTAESN